ncbi:hypothetical protein JL721_7133 [Aureococcus anophagefferens]|nr:hypothetical protein JL721_7133 [Aureococcus anophagefferens]
MPKPKAPSEAELLEACRAAKAAHPDFGVKRVYNHVAASKPEWRLTERRVQKLGWVLKASGVLGGDDDDYYEDDADDERRREVPEGMARVQWLDKYEPSLEAMDALRCVDRPFVVGDVVAARDDPTGAFGAVVRVVRTETRCAVRWSVAAADGAARGVGGGGAVAVVSSLDLVPRQHLGEHDFLPNDFVIKRVDEKSDDDDDEPPAEDDGAVGVVRCVVRWLGDGEADALEPLAPAKTETLSAYELALHGSYNFSAGDLVLRLAPGAGPASDVAGDGDGAAGATRDAAGAIAIVALPDDVLSLADGAVAVLWLDGSRELVPPRRLLLVPGARRPAYDDEDADDQDDDGTAESVSTQGPVEPDDEAEAAAPAAEAAADDGDDDGGDDAAAGGAAATATTEPFAVCDGGAPADHAYASAAAQKVALPAERSDLLRCVIVGPDGTPYERMVFAFDLQLPAAYPKEPPAMHYHSWGITERLNPNLYENGKVCLSLLGTWSGPGWDPESSTVLQLLATISAAKRPPAPFRAVLVEHFKAHADAMAKDLETAASDGDGAPAEGAPAYSDGFRRVLRKLLPQFRRALDKLGVKLQ